MKDLHLTLGPVRYNPETGCFETLAEIAGNGERIAYPVDLPAPITAGFEHVMGCLRSRALALHRSGRAPLRLRRVTPAVCGMTPPAFAA